MALQIREVREIRKGIEALEYGGNIAAIKSQIEKVASELTGTMTLFKANIATAECKHVIT